MDKTFTSMQNKDKVFKPTGADSNNSKGSATGDGDEQKLPKGVVLGKDGKPCRSCMSVRDWMAMARREGGGTGSSTSSASPSSSMISSSPSTSAASSTSTYPSDCPPDVDALGNHTWTFLHTLSASYPEQASASRQSDMRSFMSLFAKLYPCWLCAEDFATWMAEPGNQPRVRGRNEFGQWMCEAHNEVNRKLGKAEFDCARWKERWLDGWKDGRCN